MAGRRRDRARRTCLSVSVPGAKSRQCQGTGEVPTLPPVPPDSGSLSVPLKSVSVGGQPLPRGMVPGDGARTQTPKRSVQLCLEPLNSCLRFSGLKQNKNLIHCFQSYRKRKCFFCHYQKKKNNNNQKKKKQPLCRKRGLNAPCFTRQTLFMTKAAGNGGRRRRTLQWTRSLMSKSSGNALDSEPAAGEEKRPKAVLRPNNGRTDGSPGSPRRVRAYGGTGRGGRVWGPGRKHEALTTLKVKEGRRVDLGTGAFSHQLAKVDVSGYRHCMPTGCRAHAPPEILGRPAVPSWRAQLTPQSWVGRAHPSGSQKLTLGKLPPPAA